MQLWPVTSQAESKNQDHPYLGNILLTAFQKKDYVEIDRILKKSGPINFASPELLNETMWHAVGYQGPLAFNLLHMLLKKGADINTSYQCQSLLFVAITANNLPVIKLLLNMKAKVSFVHYPPEACTLEEFLFNLPKLEKPNLSSDKKRKLG